MFKDSCFFGDFKLMQYMDRM